VKALDNNALLDNTVDGSTKPSLRWADIRKVAVVRRFVKDFAVLTVVDPYGEIASAHIVV
jgi:hypothetical protein